jgi:hypothetical protein
MIQINVPTPHAKQWEILNDNARFKVINSGRRFGKSLCAHIKIIDSMLQGGVCCYLTPEYDLAKHMFNELCNFFPDELKIVANKSDLYIELPKGGSCKFFSGQAIEKIRGREYDLAIIDEAGYIEDLYYAFWGVLRPLLGTTKGECWMISTPKGNNYFTQLFLDVRAGKKGNEFSCFHFTSYDNPYFDKEELENIKANTPAILFRQEYLAEFTANSSNPFNNEDIEKNIIPILSTEKTVCYGIDISFGRTERADSSSIIGLSSSGAMTYYRNFKLPNLDMQYEIISNLPNKGALKVIDASGFSAGVSIYQRLVNDGHYVEGFQFTASSKPPLMYELIQNVESGSVSYIKEVADELKVFEMKYNTNGNVVLQAQSGFHDDNIAALAMCLKYTNMYFRQTSKWKGFSTC